MGSYTPPTFDRTTGKRTWAAATVLSAALVLGACGHSSPPPTPPAPSTTEHPTRSVGTDDTALGTVTISGSVTDEGGSPLASAIVTFSPLGGGSSRTVLSDENGIFTLELAPGRYAASCASLDGDCTPADAPGEPSVEVTVSTPDFVDFVVEGTGANAQDRGSSPDPVPSPPPPGPDDSPQAQCLAGGYTVCGFVRQNGQPVPGLVIEAKFGNQNQTVTTNDHGGYGLKLQISVATLVCVESSEMLENHLTCQAEGSGGQPVSVSSDESGLIVNFTVVPV